jgi:pimeloyl-ACP methyl ester carboxylesterase
MPKRRRIEYEALGVGPAILALHGTPGGHDQALAVLRPLVARGFRLLAPSRPEYLGTSLDVGRTPAEQADAVAGLLDDLDEGPLIVAGFSGGGPTAIELAVRHPRKTKALLLLSAVAGRLVTPGTPLIRRMALSDSTGWLLRALFERSRVLGARMLLQRLSTLKGVALTDYVHALVADPSDCDRLRDLLTTMTASSRRRVGLENDVRQQARWDRPSLEAIACPVLVVHGRADGSVPFSHAESVARHCPRATLVAVEAGSHLCYLGPGSAAANERVVSFLRENTGGDGAGPMPLR